ncbi:Phosphoribosylformylglycinamidine synthase subunit PurQ [bioreactor metagenome]|uniref:Phosphoribosylformylglycinamidine synthase subunit PurQ n=1 Tax=bioreactor metagenome TaxID=1076179 RepID=A0A644ZQW6_9ZZZZ
MSGTFENIDVPPTLVSFAVSYLNADSIITPELKETNSRLYLIKPKYKENAEPDFTDLKHHFDYVHSLIKSGQVLSAWSVGAGGAFEGICKMSFGNKIGVDLYFTDISELFRTVYGAVIVETRGEIKNGQLLGFTKPTPEINLNSESIAINTLVDAWESRLEGVFPINSKEQTIRKTEDVPIISYLERNCARPLVRTPRPRVIIPVFPGTNCEYDTARAFRSAGADPDIFVFKNITPRLLDESIDELAKLIDEAQILMIPGGFSGGDEPDGSGKFITAVMRNSKIADSLMKLLDKRDGLVLGICNGFQALIKLGLLPYGEIRQLSSDDATLTFNSIGRHQSILVRTRVASVKSPWLSKVNIGDIHTVAISHGEGRFTAAKELITKLEQNGQIATQYVDASSNPTMNIRYNPNCSDAAIEGIFSPDGRVFGKMGHSERAGINVYKNVPGEKDQKIFASGVSYFK